MQGCMYIYYSSCMFASWANQESINLLSCQCYYRECQLMTHLDNTPYFSTAFDMPVVKNPGVGFPLSSPTASTAKNLWPVYLDLFMIFNYIVPKLCIVKDRGFPQVEFVYPYPYPPKPLPLAEGMGFLGVRGWVFVKWWGGEHHCGRCNYHPTGYSPSENILYNV